MDAISAFLLQGSTVPTVDGGGEAPLEDIDLEALLDDLEEADFGAPAVVDMDIDPPSPSGEAVVNLATPPKRTVGIVGTPPLPSPRRPPSGENTCRSMQQSVSPRPQNAQHTDHQTPRSSPQCSPHRGLESPQRSDHSPRRSAASMTPPRTPRTPRTASLSLRTPPAGAQHGVHGVQQEALRSPRHCQLCRNHDQDSSWGNGHGRVCPYRACTCEACQRTMARRRECATQGRMQRDLRMPEQHSFRWVLV